MRPARIAALVLAVLAVGYVGSRVAAFVRIFGAHAGIALTQEQVALAHSASTPDRRPQVVPKIIHQIFHNWKDPEDGALPTDWEAARRTCVEKNPGWEHRLWTQKVSRDFIESSYPWFLATYDGFRFPVQRVDALRYFLMRHYGGIYVDLDNGCRESLEPLLYYPVWVTDGGHGALSNNILGGAPDHPFYRMLTDSIMPFAWNYVFPYVTISYATGQWLVTIVWERYHAQLPASTSSSMGDAPADASSGPLHRVMMDMRPDAAPWVFFTQERGGTWQNWDNRMFGWIGGHLLVSLVLMLLALGLGGMGLWSLRQMRRKGDGYKELPH